MGIDDHQNPSQTALVVLVVMLLECSLLVKAHTVGGQSQVGTRSSAVVLVVVVGLVELVAPVGSNHRLHPINLI